MKKWLVFLIAGSVLVACNNESSDHDHEHDHDMDDTTAMHEDHDHGAMEMTESTGTFGEEITDDGAKPVSQLLDMLGDQEEVEVKLVGDVNAVCQRKGCWMTMELANGEEMTVRFKDYEFFVPKDCAGKEAVIKGVAKRKTMTVEDLKHYARDAGKSEEEVATITEPEQSIEFMADGVIIRNKG